MLRSRDIVAVLLAVVLARMAWTSGPPDDASLSASMRLAFYAKARLAAPLDVDGDGILEAVVVAVDSQQGDWELQVLDLKALHSSSIVSSLPFVPPVLFSARVDRPKDAIPLKLTTGQIIWNHHYHHHRLHMHLHGKKDDAQSEDRTRHYFCGKDWHDAAKECRQHCPSGSASDCPNGEICYADTPCDALRQQHSDMDKPQNYTLTPAGGLPTVMAYWSDGSLTVHILSSSPGQSLELQLLWQTNTEVKLDQVHVDLLASEEVRTDSHLGQHGMILVGGTYEEDEEVVSVMRAFDAMTGDHMWSTPKAERKTLDGPLFPKVRGDHSVARRRSQIVKVLAHTESTELPNCLVAFKQLLKGGLPHSHFGPPDVHVTPLHLHRHKHQRHRSSKHAVHGRPNVLLSHYRDGIHVRSLLNGHALCHLSLLEKVVYADLNQDGILDHVQVVTNEESDTQQNEWIEQLMQQLKEEDPLAKQKRKLPSSNRLCHILALSGMPTREQLFSANLCGDKIAKDRGDHASIALEAAPPLVVEGSHVTVALNNGMISRYHVNGRRQWQTILRQNVITWGADSMAASLSVLESRKGRPMLLTGENGMVLLSMRSGKVLADVSFPQTSLDRPIVADVSGDGTSDIMIRSADAIWGYHVVVQSGASTLFRILVGLLLMGMALALLRNRFGQKNDKRSTDA